MKHKDYSRIASKFRFYNPFCQVNPKHRTESVHHKMGREGYADQWARDNDIPLVIDERYFLACCIACHNKIEENPEWAYEKGYSIPRANTHIK